MGLFDFLFKRACVKAMDAQAASVFVDEAMKRSLGQDISMKTRLARTALTAGRDVEHGFAKPDRSTDKFMAVLYYILSLQLLVPRKGRTIYAIVTESVDEVPCYRMFFREQNGFIELMHSFDIDVRWGIPDWKRIEASAKQQPVKLRNYHLVVLAKNEFRQMRRYDRAYIDRVVLDTNDSYRLVDIDSPLLSE